MSATDFQKKINIPAPIYMQGKLNILNLVTFIMFSSVGSPDPDFPVKGSIQETQGSENVRLHKIFSSKIIKNYAKHCAIIYL